MTTLTQDATADRAAPRTGGTPLRIAYLADDLYPGYGGQARATEGHIEALVERGHEVRVLAGHEERPTDPPPGVSVRRLPVWRPGEAQTHFATVSPTAVQWLLREADVLHANTPTPLAAWACGVARSRRLPSVMGVHAQLESTTLHFGRGRAVVGSALSAWYRFVYSIPHALVAPTPFAAKLAARSSARPVHVVSNGIRLPAERLSRCEARRQLAGRLEVTAAEHILVYVGRLSPEKRPGDLLELLSGMTPETHLWIAGAGPLESDLRRAARAQGLAERVSFLGYVSEEEKHLLLAAADLFVMPSPTELQSIATLEAMAFGCAVAAADFPSSAVPGLIAEAGAGEAYPPGDLDAAARQIRSLLADGEKLRTMQARALATAADHRVERSAEALEELYVGLVGAKRGST